MSKGAIHSLGFFVQDIPPSVNHYWMASGKKRYLSKEARAWKNLVYLSVKSIPLEKWTAIEDPLEMEISYTFPDNHRRDIDNYNKGVLDSLNGLLYVDDSQIVKLTVEKSVQKGIRETFISVRKHEPTA